MSRDMKQLGWFNGNINQLINQLIRLLSKYILDYIELIEIKLNKT